MLYQLIVVGGGIGGAAAALRAAQYNIPTLWILGDRKTAKGSRSKWVKNIGNMIGIHPDIVLSKVKDVFKDDPALLAKLNELHLDISTEDIVNNVKDRLKNYADVITVQEGVVQKIEKLGDQFQVGFIDESLKPATAQYVVVSTGVMDFQPTIHRILKDKPSPKTAWIYPYANEETVLYCMRCEGHLTRQHKTAVIGYSDVAAQIAIILFERYRQVSHILLNGENSQIQNDSQKLLEQYGIAVVSEKIIDFQHKENNKGALHAIVLENQRVISVDFAFVSMGLYKVYHELLQGLNIQLAAGSQPDSQKRVLVDSKAETHEANLFCVGDMAVRADEAVMMQVYTAQEYAVRAVDAIDRRRRLTNRSQTI